MFNKITLLRGATALLYMGPLLAGMAGFGWELVPVLALLFILWLLFLRPETWPTRKGDGPRPGSSWLTLVARSLVQVLLVVVLFGVARGIGGVTDLVLRIPFGLPVIVSALAVLLGRVIWNPDETPQTRIGFDPDRAQ